MDAATLLVRALILNEGPDREVLFLPWDKVPNPALQRAYQAMEVRTWVQSVVKSGGLWV